MNDLVNLNNINHVRDFIDIRDIYSAIKLLYIKKTKGIYNLGSGKPTPLIKVVEYLATLFNKKFLIKESNKKTIHVANIKKIIKLGWKPEKNLAQILKSYHLNYKKR